MSKKKYPPPALVPGWKRRINAAPEHAQLFAQRLALNRDGWRDEQRAHVREVAVEAATLGAQDMLHRIRAWRDENAGGEALLPRLEAYIDRLDPDMDGALETAPRRGLSTVALDKAIEKAVDGVDDDIESVAEMLSDEELFPASTLEGLDPNEALEHAFSGNLTWARLGEAFGDKLRTDAGGIDSRICFEEFVRNLSPTQREDLAAALVS
jgi:hypothetical protein